MKITIFNLKGGQGKTTLSLALALQYGYLIATNDIYSPIDKVLPTGKGKILKEDEAIPNIPDHMDVIFDFGGYADSRVIDAAKASDWVIVPIINKSELDIQKTIKSVHEIEPFNSNIIIAINETTKGDFDTTKQELAKHLSYPCREVKKSTAFARMIKKKKSIEELMQDSLLSYHYKKPFGQIAELQKLVNGD